MTDQRHNETLSHTHDFVLIFSLLCVSLTFWCQILHFLGYEDADTALISLYELPLLLFYAPFVRGSQLASIAIGLTMAITCGVWAEYLGHIVVEHINAERHIGHVLFIPLIATVVLLKLYVAYVCTLSPSFRRSLRRLREEYQIAEQMRPVSSH